MGGLLGSLRGVDAGFYVIFAENKTKKRWDEMKNKRPTALFWSRIRDSNPPPTAWEAVALPDELTLQVRY